MVTILLQTNNLSVQSCLSSFVLTTKRVSVDVFNKIIKIPVNNQIKLMMGYHTIFYFDTLFLSEYYHYNDFLDVVDAYELDLEDNRIKAASDIVKKVNIQ